MEFSYRKIPLRSLKLYPAPYKITTNENIETLAESISEIGLLQPIITFRDADEFVILAGHRRAAACLHLGCETIATQIAPANTSKIQKAMIAIGDNTTQRVLNMVEQARAVNMLQDAASDKKEIITLASRAGLKLSMELVAKLETVVEMEPAVRQGLVSGVISLPIAMKLKKFDDATAETLAYLFIKMKIGLNRQRQILTWLEEIALRDKRPLLDVLNSLNIIANSKDDNQKDTGTWAKSIIDEIRRARFPQLVETETKFKSGLKKLKIPSGMTIEHPPYFESKNYKVTLRISNSAELANYAVRLKKIASMQEFSKILI